MRWLAVPPMMRKNTSVNHLTAEQEAQIVRELARVKAEFQLRAIIAAMGVAPGSETKDKT